MKIANLKNKTTGQETVIEIEFWKIIMGLVSAGLITGIIAVLTFLFIDLPSNNLSLKNDYQHSKLEILNFVLRSNSDTTRMNSLNLLINSGIIDDPDGNISDLIKLQKIPDWSDMPTFRPQNGNPNPNLTPLPEPEK